MNKKDQTSSSQEKLIRQDPEKTQAGFSHIEVLVGLVVLAILGVGLWTWFTQSPTNQTTPPVTGSALKTSLANDLVPPDEKVPADARLAPQLKFDEYVLETDLPKIETPNEVSLYQLKTSLSVQKRQQIGQKLGLTTVKTLADSSTVALTNLEDKNSRGYLFIDEDGAFEFKSFGVHKTSTTSTDPKEVAKTFLKDLGLWEDNFKITTTYQRKGLEGITYVEIHRIDPDLQILNPLGLVSVPQETSLHKLTAGNISSRLPDDPSIINVSNGQDGKARPNDFNTITVAVADDGRVLQANSNMRLLESKQSLADAGLQLKTPQEAFEEVKQNQAIFGVTLPVGEGIPNLAEIYPNNEARAKKATVTDVVLTLLEKPPNRKMNYLQPVYAFRGIATLTTGPTVQWSAVVPAVRQVNVLSGKRSSSGVISDAYAQSDAGSVLPRVYIEGLGEVQIGGKAHTIYTTPELEEQNVEIEQVRKAFFEGPVVDQYLINIAKVATAHADVNSQLQAATTVDELYALFTRLNAAILQYEGELGLSAYARGGQNSKEVAPFRIQDDRWYATYNHYPNVVAEKVASQLLQMTSNPPGTATPSPTTSATPAPTHATTTPKTVFEPLTVSNNNLQSLAQRDHIFPAPTRRNFDWIFMSVMSDHRAGPEGGRWITGESPTIFVYHAPENLSIRLPEEKLTYREPLLNNRLYYEFDSGKTNLGEPKRGLVVSKSQVISHTRALAQQMGLNPQETHALTTDVKRILSKDKFQSAPYVRISFVEPTTLNQQLPVEVNPQPQTFTRIHLLLEPLNKPPKKPAPPTLPKVTRSQYFYLIEVGALAKN